MNLVYEMKPKRNVEWKEGKLAQCSALEKVQRSTWWKAP